MGLALVMNIITAPSSLADATPTPIALTVMEQYKVAMNQYRTIMGEREQVRKEINKIFITGCRTANDGAKTAMRAAKTADAKSIVLAQLKAAIALATSARDAAIVAMGPAPIEPLKPAKLSEITPLKNGKSVKPTPAR